jgi:hypothetical protein
MYINAVADSVVLYLRHDFYNILFKMKHKLYLASGSGGGGPAAEATTGAEAEAIEN